MERWVLKATDIATIMAATSITLIGILLLVVYEFYHAGDIGRMASWIDTAHAATASAISFSASAVMSFVLVNFRLSRKSQKRLKWGLIIAFLLGWVLTFAVLGKIYLETRI